MEKVEAWPIAGIEMDCPDCGKTIQELGDDPRDTVGYDPDIEGEIECPYCNVVFTYYIPDDY